MLIRSNRTAAADSMHSKRYATQPDYTVRTELSITCIPPTTHRYWHRFEYFVLNFARHICATYTFTQWQYADELNAATYKHYILNQGWPFYLLQRRHKVTCYNSHRWWQQDNYSHVCASKKDRFTHPSRAIANLFLNFKFRTMHMH